MTQGVFRLMLVADGPARAGALAAALSEGSAGRLVAHPVPTFDLAIECAGKTGGDAIVVDSQSSHLLKDDALARLRTAAPGTAVIVRGGGHGARSIPLLDDGARAPLVALALDQALEQHRLDESLRSQEERYRAIVDAQHADKVAVLARVASLLASATDKGEVFHAVARAAIALLGARAAQVLVDDPSASVLRSAGESEPARQSTWPARLASAIPHRSGLAGAVWESRQPVFVEDVQEEPRWLGPDFVREHDLHAYAGLPLVARGRAVGVLSILFAERRTFTQEERELMALLADQAAIAIENAQLFAETERRHQAAEALSRVGRVLSQSLDVGEVARQIAVSAQGLMRISAFAVYRLDPPSGDLVPVTFSGDVAPLFGGGHRLARGTGAAGLAVRRARTVFTPDFLVDPSIDIGPEDRPLFEAASYRAVLSIPLFVRGRVTGVLSLGRPAGASFSDGEIEIAEAFADQAAVALENARLFAEAERRRRSAEALAEVGRLMAQSPDPQEMSDFIAENVQRLLGLNSVVLFHLRSDTQELVSASVRGDVGPTDGSPIVYPVGMGVVGVAAQIRKPVVTADLTDDPLVPQPPEHLARVRQAPFHSALALPLIVQDRVVGALALGDRAGRVYTGEDVQIAQAFADRAALALETARLYQQVRTAHDFLKSIAESSADAIVTTDIDGHITYWSRGAEEALGYRAEDMLGQSLDGLYQSGRAEVERIERRLRVEERIPDYETSMRAKDGSWREVTAAFSLLRDASGAITGALAVVKDVTQRRQLEESLRQSQKMEAIGRLAGGIAHDFNNLMTVVIGRAELLLARLWPEDPVRHDVELFRRTAERAATLTRQLLAFSRQQVLQPRIFDLNAVVARMESMLRRLIGEDIAFTIRLAPDLDLITADPGQLEQVIVNLAVNARDAMPQGGQLTIETANVELDRAHGRRRGSDQREPWVMLSVRDTGVGMDEVTVARIFEPFFTTKETGKGTGLGLSTVYGIVQQSGGDIRVQSEPGRGTTFALYFPREQAIGAGEEQAAPAARAAGRRQTILLVEDEPELRGVVRQMLEHCGYVALEAEHAAEAVWIAANHRGPIHLLLTDVVMPDMSGRALARRVSACRPGIKTVFMSGYTDEAIVRHGVLDGGTTYLEKPFDAEQLAVKIDAVLATST